MPVAQCSNCNHSLTAGEQRDGWCEACGKRLARSDIASPFSNSPSEREPSPSFGGRINYSVLGWCTVRTALTQLIVGQLLLLFGIAGVALLFLAETAPGASSDGPGTGRAAFTPLCFGALIAGGVLFAAGIVMTCSAPEESRARLLGGLATFFLAMGVLAVLFMIFANAENERVRRANMLKSIRFDPLNARVRNTPDEEPPFGPIAFTVMRYGATGLFLLCQAFLILFLGRVAYYFGRPGLAICLLIFLIVWLTAVAVNLGMTTLADKMDYLWWIVLAVGVTIYLVFLVLVLVVRQTVVRNLIG